MRLSYSILRRFITIGCVAPLFLPPAYAEELAVEIFIPPHQQGVPLIDDFVFLERGSTLGFGPEVSKNLSPKVNFRISFESLRDIDDRARRRVNNRFDLKLRSFSFLLDWHPFGGSFRTTLGVLINQHTLRVDAVPTQTLDLDSTSLSDEELSAAVLRRLNLTTLDLSDGVTIDGSDLLTARARLRFNDFAPYLGIGWGNTTRADRRLYYTFDLGVAFHGSPEVELNVRGLLAEIVREHGASELNAFLASEEKRLEDELKDLDVFPVVSFGLLYRFGSQKGGKHA